MLLALLCATFTLGPFAGLGGQALGAEAAGGKPIALGKISSPTTARAHFHHVRPAQTFELVLMAPAKAQVNVTWTVDCYDPAHNASGGAKGQATIVNGYWSKRVRADWIKHPEYCSGSVVGLDESSRPEASMLHIHVYAG
jgi:hypothetical protein